MILKSYRYLLARMRWKLACGAVVAVLAVPLAGAIAAEPASDAAQAEVVEPETSATAPDTKVVHVDWITDLALAQKTAREENKDILLFFTGSDWCGFCIKLEKAVLTTPEFSEFIADKYVPVVLDFPNKTELPEELAEQNQRLKDELGATGFPAVFIADPNILPYGKIGGFSGAEAYWASLKQVAEVGSSIRQIKGDLDIASITDGDTLDRIISVVPDSLLLHGWPGQVERLSSSQDPANAAFREKWAGKLASMQHAVEDRELIAEANRTLRGLAGQKAPPEQILAVLNTGIAESTDRSIRLKFYFGQKSRFLQSIGEYEQALAVVQEHSAAPWVTPKEKNSLNTQYKRLLFLSGRIDEGVELIKQVESRKKYPSEHVRQSHIAVAAAGDLLRSRQHAAALGYLRQIYSELDHGSTLGLNASFYIDSSCRNAGTDHVLRGQALLTISEHLNATGQVDSAEIHALQAAITFRAANRDDLVQATLTRINLDELVSIPESEEVEKQSPNSVTNLIKTANGSQADALLHLSRGGVQAGRAVYLLQAADALVKDHREAESRAAAGEAVQILEQLDPKYPDRTVVAQLQTLADEWRSRHLSPAAVN